MKRTLIATAILAALASSPAAFAAGSHSDGHGNSSAIGEAGKASEATRNIVVSLYDNYYEPENIRVSAGETVRFTITNSGDLVHEFNIGTAAMHEKHQEEMMMMMQHGALEPDKINHDMMKMDMGNGKTMEHNDPNSVLLEPGETKDIVWRFPDSGTLEFACNVPGHYQSGMVGNLTISE